MILLKDPSNTDAICQNDSDCFNRDFTRWNGKLKLLKTFIKSMKESYNINKIKANQLGFVLILQEILH